MITQIKDWLSVYDNIQKFNIKCLTFSSCAAFFSLSFMKVSPSKASLAWQSCINSEIACCCKRWGELLYLWASVLPWVQMQGVETDFSKGGGACLTFPSAPVSVHQLPLGAVCFLLSLPSSSLFLCLFLFLLPLSSPPIFLPPFPPPSQQDSHLGFFICLFQLSPPLSLMPATAQLGLPPLQYPMWSCSIILLYPSLELPTHSTSSSIPSSSPCTVSPVLCYAQQAACLAMLFSHS